MIAGKVWGQTELLEANGVLEMHRIDVQKGGTCSQHRHQFKWNGFYVISGRLRIRVWKNDYDLCDETVLGPGDYTKVAPTEYHQFEAEEDTVAIELYWAEFDHQDIERRDPGFMKSTKGSR